MNLAAIITLLLTASVYGGNAFAAVFANGTLIRGSDRPEVYLLEKGSRRWIPDPQTFNALGLNWSNIQVVASEDLSSYPDGDKITDTRKFPDGLLYRADNSPKVYVIDGGRRRWIPDPATFVANAFVWENINIVSPGFFKSSSIGANMTMPATAFALDVIILEKPPAVSEDAALLFKFAAPGVPVSARASVSFETYIVGLDKKWTSNGQTNTRKITLTKGGDFVFYVRAKTTDGRYSTVPASYDFKSLLSAQYKVIKISGVTGKEADPMKEQLTLTTSAKAPISLTGWTIEGKMKSRYSFPQAADVPDFSGWDAVAPLTLGQGEKLIVITGRSPVALSAFRVNKCMGYISKADQFRPALPSNCPKPDPLEYSSLASACQNYIKSLPVCTAPSNIIDTRINQDSICMDYLRSKFSYTSCVRNYRYDADFTGAKEWRAYLGLSSGAWDNTSDHLILRDAQGLIVDTFDYK